MRETMQTARALISYNILPGKTPFSKEITDNLSFTKPDMGLGGTECVRLDAAECSAILAKGLDNS